MGQVAVTINGRKYPVACDDGQEEHVTRLAAYLDKRAVEIGDQVGAVSEGRLLVMTSLLVADELSEAYDEVERLQDEAKIADKRARETAQVAVEDRYAGTVAGLAERIERIAATLEKT